MYRIVKSLCCAPETNIALYVNYPSVTKIKIIYPVNSLAGSVFRNALSQRAFVDLWRGRHGGEILRFNIGVHELKISVRLHSS